MSGLEQTLVAADGRDSAETSVRGLASWAALVALLALGGARDAATLWRTPIAVGVDGYYYVIQITHIAESGRLFFPTRTPLMLYALTALEWLVGSPVAAIKLAGVLLHVLLCAGVFAVVRRALRDPWMGVLGAALAAFSGLHLFMVSEFINNLGALSALVWAGYFLLGFRQTRSTRQAVAAAALFAVAVMTHRSVLPLTLAALASLLLFRWFDAAVRRGRFNWYALGLALFACLAPALLAVQRVVQLPVWLAGGVTARPRLMFTEWFLADAVLLALAAATSLVLLISRCEPGETSAGRNLVGATAVFSVLLTFNPFLFSPDGVTGPAGRLRVIAYLQVALVVPGLIWLIRRRRPQLAPYVLAAVVPLLFFSVAMREPAGLRKEFLARREGLLRGLKSRAPELGPGPLVVATHGDQFVVRAATGLASEQTPPAGDGGRQVYWLLDYPQGPPLPPGALGLTSGSNPDLLLLDDGRLKQYLEGGDEVMKRQLLRGNPHLVMAYYLRGYGGGPRRKAASAPTP